MQSAAPKHHPPHPDLEIIGYTGVYELPHINVDGGLKQCLTEEELDWLKGTIRYGIPVGVPIPGHIPTSSTDESSFTH